MLYLILFHSIVTEDDDIFSKGAFVTDMTPLASLVLVTPAVRAHTQDIYRCHLDSFIKNHLFYHVQFEPTSHL